jgi:hypothetical protein
MGQHAILSPSGAEKWMNCAGAPAMERGLPNDSNGYSDEGTAAHLLGSTCLEQGNNPEDYRGLKILVGEREDFDGAEWYTEGTSATELMMVRRTYTVDDEMIDAIGRYVDRVRQYATGATFLMPEQRISISAYTGEENAAGTSDAAVVMPGELQVHDLKYGMGVRVNAEWNKQLMIYALGVREELGMTHGPFTRIRLVIHQPRLQHLSEWDCTSDELTAFGEEVKYAAARARELYENNSTDPDWLSPSDDACRWCKAKPTCPALAEFVADAAAMDFDAIDSSPQVPSDLALLGAKFKAIPLIEDWCKAVRAKSESVLIESKNSPEVINVLGIKLVEGKRGSRVWSDVEKAEEILKSMRMTMEERYKMTLLSPPAIEKVLKGTPKRWKRILDAKLITQSEGKPSVALADDKQPAWVPPDTSADFEAITEEATA